MIFAYARARKLMTHDPTEGVRARKPVPGTRSKKRPNKEKPQAFTLEQSKALASHLNIHGQLVFWIERLMAPRIGEVFGIFLDDLIWVEGQLLLDVVRQGGRSFEFLDKDGRKVKERFKDILKTDAAYRTIPVPGELARFIGTYVEAFHGAEPQDRHVPLIKPWRSFTQAAYRRHFNRGLLAAGLGEDDLGYKVGSHHLRISMSSQVGHHRPPTGVTRSQYLGHKVKGYDGGAAVTDRHYTLSMPRITEFLAVSDLMDRFVKDEIGGLVTPMSRVQLLDGSLEVTSPENEAALVVLEEAGLVAATEANGEELLTTAEVVELLAVSARRVRSMVAQGILKAEALDLVRGMPRRGITLSSVTELLELQQGLWTRAALMRELELSEKELRRLVKQLGIVPLSPEGVTGHRFDDEMVHVLRGRVESIRSLIARAVTTDDAAVALGVVVNTVERFVRMGLLELDAEASELAGVQMVQRESLEALVAERARGRRSVVRPPEGFIPITEAQERLGLGRMEVLALGRRGLVVHRTSDYRFHVEEATLVPFLRGQP
jgi:hypothetical protein